MDKDKIMKNLNDLELSISELESVKGIVSNLRCDSALKKSWLNDIDREISWFENTRQDEENALIYLEKENGLV